MKTLIAALALVLVSTTAIAQQNSPPCGDRTKFIETLGGQYKESPSAIGLAANGQLVEILSNDETGTFSILLTKPNGESCLVSSGTGWYYLSGDEKNLLLAPSH